MTNTRDASQRARLAGGEAAAAPAHEAGHQAAPAAPRPRVEERRVEDARADDSSRRPRRPAAWAEIDLAALRSNLYEVRARAGGRRVIAVVKADAYGHGVRVVAPALAAAGVDALAVATLAEGLELRMLGLAVPVLVLQGLVHVDDADACVSARLAPAVGRPESLPALAAAARRAGVRAPIHLKVDTGMGRLGLAPGDLDAALDTLVAEPALALEGVLTQLAEADDPASPATARQRASFEGVVERIRARGFTPDWVHADPSAAVLHRPTDVATAVRPGIMLYGADPTLDGAASVPHDREDARCAAGLTPVMTVRCEVIHAKWVEAGARIGYGGTYTTSRRTRILTLPVGYADGLPRSVGGRAEVALAAGRAPLVGRISMDLATVDAGPESTADVGDVACIFGTIGRGATDAGVLPIEALASAAGTIPYEILTGIGPRLPRLPRG